MLADHIASIYWDSLKGQRLKALRGKESPKSLADRAGLSRQLIERLEKNQASSTTRSRKCPVVVWRTLEALCGALSISVEDFLQVQSIRNPKDFSETLDTCNRGVHNRR